MTYSYVMLPLSQAAYDEIAAKLRAAGYDHVFHREEAEGVVIDMHGIALMLEPAKKPAGKKRR